MSGFDVAAARRWMADVVETLDRERGQIDDLNVFPVADADTGTNMYFTVRSGIGSAREVPDDAPLGRLLGAFASGAMRGARGNSGLILSVALHGFAAAIDSRVSGANPPDDGAADLEALADALTAANSRAWASVTGPVDGTMLTVLAESARAATQPVLPAGSSIAELLTRCLDAAGASLSATENQLEVLSEAHVVDAGGIGVLRLLEALARSMDVAVPPDVVRYGTAVTRTETDYGYEIIGELGTADTSRLKGDLTGLGGTSMVVADTSETTSTLHVHVPDRDAARAGVAAINRYGTIRHVRISSLVAGRADTADTAPGLITMARGAGLTATFALAGAEVLPSGDDPSATARQLRETIESLGNHDVIVLPNSPIALSIALDVRERDKIVDGEIAVIPSRSHVQGLAAAAVFDAGAPLDAVTAAMTEAAESTRHGAVLVAAASGCNALVGPWAAGDVLGRIDGSVNMLGASTNEVARSVLRELLGPDNESADDPGAELVTLITGEQCPDDLVTELSGELEARGLDVTVLDGGSSQAVLLMGVE